MRLTSLLTIEMLAFRWGMDEGDLMDLIDEGKAPAMFITPSGGKRFRGSDVLEFEAKNTK